MTRLLVSVRDAAEARTAVAAGAHLVDVKEPERGALGNAGAATIREVLAAVDGHCPVSAALGELVGLSSEDLDGRLAGIRYAKLGLSQCGLWDAWPTAWARALRGLPAGTNAVAVAYADHRAAQAPSPLAVLNTGAQLGCRALLVDTFDKRQGTLFDHLTAAATTQLILRARDNAMVTVLAGSLRDAALDRAVELAPDYVAVRGAVCPGGRNGRLHGTLVRHYVERLSRHDRPAATAFLDSAGHRLDTEPERCAQT